jgi:hypothetical protein
LLREKGVAIRTAPDLIIGVFRIASGHAPLHEDRDFDALTLGLAAH